MYGACVSGNLLFHNRRKISDEYSRSDRSLQSGVRVRFYTSAKTPAQLTLKDVGIEDQVEPDTPF